MVQEQKTRQKAKTREEESHTDGSNTDVTNAELAQKTQETLDSIEDVLDEQLDEELLSEMDDVLEENAEEFVFNYVQQGGE